MMLRFLPLAALLLPIAAAAQVSQPPAVDLSAFATKAEADEARAAAAAAAAAAATAVKQSDLQALQAAMMAAMPQPSTAPPSADMATGGQVGSSMRYRRVDDQAPRISRSVSGTSGGVTGGLTAADGVATVTWPAMPAPPKLTVTTYTTSGQANKATCSPIAGTVSVTGATIRCVRPGSVLGLGVLPADVNVAGVPFDVLVLPGS